MKMKRWIGVVLILAMSFLNFGMPQKSGLADGQDFTRIDAQQAKKALEENEEAILLDVRTQEEYDESHIPGATLLPLDRIESDAAEVLPDMNIPIYVYCRSGNRSVSASAILAELGYTQVYEFGGIMDWPYDTISTAEEDAPAAKETPDTESTATGLLSSFATTNLAGEEVNQKIITDNKLTMINIWATYCGPCLSEMPDLGKLNEEYADRGFKIVGIVSDVQDTGGQLDEGQVQLANDIIEQTGANYPHIVPSADLYQTILSGVSAVPATIFIDSNGDPVGSGYLGAYSYDDWKQIIEEKLMLVEQPQQG